MNLEEFHLMPKHKTHLMPLLCCCVVSFCSPFLQIFVFCAFMCAYTLFSVRVRAVLVYLLCTTEIMCHISKYLNAENYYS